MAGLRRFEIDAIVATIESKVNAHNNGITVSDTEIKNRTRDKYPKVLEYRKTEVKIRELNNRLNILREEIKKEYGTGRNNNYYPIRTAEQSVKNEILDEKGAKVLDKSDITNQIIIAGSSENLEEIIANITAGLGL